MDIEDAQSVEQNLERIKEIMLNNITLDKTHFFGDGKSAELIVATIEKELRSTAKYEI